MKLKLEHGKRYHCTFNKIRRAEKVDDRGKMSWKLINEEDPEDYYFVHEDGSFPYPQQVALSEVEESEVTTGE